MSVPSTDWMRVKAIFDAAVVLEPNARAACLSSMCGSDDGLRQDVEALLASHDRAGTFLERPAAALISRSPDELIGRTLDSYRIVSRIGAGGMGEVYKAHDLKLERDVAVKLLPRHVDADRLRRFHAEARTASSLNHPHIVVIHDFGDFDGRPFIITELVEGETLRQRLERGVLPVGEAVAIATQIASALVAAHARAIVHRDIKPENVMVRPDGYVKVLDFGLAKLVGPTAPATTVSTATTEVGVLLGTPHYMSPEQAEGKAVDERSDIFSIGVILYELATGTRPFTGDSYMSVLSSILRDAPPPIAELNPALPPDLSRIVRRCLAKDRNRRYQSATDLRGDLAELERSLSAGELRVAAPVARSSQKRHVDGAASVDSLAVLPFANATGDPETEYLSDGLTESLINRLSQIPNVRVAPRSVVFRHKGPDVDPNKAGRQLKVRTVLTGKVLQRGQALHVQAELVDVRQQAQLWGERFVRDLSDILTVEDEIAGAIVDKLRVKLTGEDRDLLGRHRTENTEAYRLFLKGWYYCSKRTRPNLQKALGYFEQAIAADPGYALPYTGVADAYVVLSVYDGGVPTDNLSRAKAAARRALEIDPGLQEAQAELTLIWACLDRDWDAAEESARIAVTRRPAYWLAHGHYAFLLAAQGRFDEAVAEVRREQALEPLSLVVHHHVAWVSLLARRYDEAIAECRSAIEMDATFATMHMWMGVGLSQKGMHDEAIASLDEAVKCMGGPVAIGVGAAAHAYAMAGRLDDARRRVADLKDARSTRYVEPYGIALGCAGLGDHDGAIEWLEHAYREHSLWLVLWGKGDPRLDVLRNDSRFQDLMRRLGLG
jgi:serine/threonine-protein kinase